MFWYRLFSHSKRDFHWLLYLEEFVLVSFHPVDLNCLRWLDVWPPKIISVIWWNDFLIYSWEKIRKWILISGKCFRVPMCSTYCMEIADNYKWPWLFLAKHKMWPVRCPIFCFLFQKNPRNQLITLLFISLLNMTQKSLFVCKVNHREPSVLFSKSMRSLDSALRHP